MLQPLFLQVQHGHASKGLANRETLCGRPRIWLRCKGALKRKVQWTLCCINCGLTTMQVALKCADVSHLAADPVLHHKWAVRLEEEMFRQGDLERAKNMAVSPLMDRHSSAGGITRTQAGALERQRLCERHAQPAALGLTQQHRWHQAHTSRRGCGGCGASQCCCRHA